MKLLDEYFHKLVKRMQETGEKTDSADSQDELEALPRT
jgi:hypothetical protein